ncbi:MAG: hypothetical protein R3Y53_09865 [Bacillota bacterium]
MKKTTMFKEKLLFDLKSAITHVPNQDEDIPRIMERYLATTSEKEKNRWLTAFIQCLNREFYEDPLQDYYRYSMEDIETLEVIMDTFATEVQQASEEIEKHIQTAVDCILRIHQKTKYHFIDDYRISLMVDFFVLVAESHGQTVADCLIATIFETFATEEENG